MLQPSRSPILISLQNLRELFGGMFQTVLLPEDQKRRSISTKGCRINLPRSVLVACSGPVFIPFHYNSTLSICHFKSDQLFSLTIMCWKRDPANALMIFVLESTIESVLFVHTVLWQKLISWRNKIPTFHIGTEPFLRLYHWDTFMRRWKSHSSVCFVMLFRGCSITSCNSVVPHRLTVRITMSDVTAAFTPPLGDMRAVKHIVLNEIGGKNIAFHFANRRKILRWCFNTCWCLNFTFIDV